MAKPNARRVPYLSLTYNTAAARYTSAAGKFLSGAKVREIIDADIEATGVRMVGHGTKLKIAAQQFKNGGMTQIEYSQAVCDWRDSMAASVKALHLSNRAAGKGGFHALTQADYGATGAALRVQYAYLSNFAIEAAGNPDIVLSLDKSRRPFDERVAAYAEAGRGTFERARHEAHKDGAFQSMENILESGVHHCKGPDSCPAHSEMGRVPIDDRRFKMPGFRACTIYCKCEVAYFKTAVVVQ